MGSQDCQICFSTKTIKLNDMLYCEACNVYYAIKKDTKHVSIFPMKEIDQTSLELCSKCKGKHDKKEHQIKCKSFNEYFSKIGFCKICKAYNKDFLSNLYYKNFLFYRKTARAFGWIHTVLLLLSILFLPALPSIRWALFLWVEYMRHNLSYSRLVLSTVLLTKLSRFLFVRDAFMFFCIFEILFTKTVIFYIPCNLLRHDHLNSFIKRLNIKDSFSIDSKKVVNEDCVYKRPTFANKHNI